MNSYTDGSRDDFLYSMCKNLRDNNKVWDNDYHKSYKKVPTYNLLIPTKEIDRIWWVIIVFAIIIPILIFLAIVILIIVLIVRAKKNSVTDLQGGKKKGGYGLQVNEASSKANMDNTNTHLGMNIA